METAERSRCGEGVVVVIAGDQASPLAEGGRNGHVEALADAVDEQGLLAPVTRYNNGGRRDRQEERQYHGWSRLAMMV